MTRLPGLLLVAVSPLALGVALLLGVPSCGSNTDSGPVGGPVSGAADTHCTGKSQATDPAVCMFRPDLAGDTADGGAPEEAAVFYNTEADDDDCKYHVKWSSTPIRQNADITFTVTVTRKSDGKPAAAAAPEAEVFLGDSHAAPGTDQTSQETSPGTYTVGPVRVDMAGRWTVRFHFYDTCFDLVEESPHGHAAFYFDVP